MRLKLVIARLMIPPSIMVLLDRMPLVADSLAAVILILPCLLDLMKVHPGLTDKP